MTMSFRLVAGLILALAPLSAQALTVQTVATDDTAWNMVNTSQTVTLPNGATWTSAPLQMPNSWFPQVDPCISFCSPFDPGIYGTNQTIGATPLPGWQQLPFWATWQTADRSNVNILSFSGIQKGLSLLWGSFDVGNLIEFVLNGVVVGSVAGDQLGLQVGNPGQGAALVSLSGIQFNELRFSSTLGGFEYANIEASPVPLPMPLAGLGAALMMLGLARRRRA
ncbi:hypothetical protein OU426_16675 [Frigidibacter sp. RF13]|uniref:hypothetical protein n=1 Tax=Frigidibacter sp. RF13 TaxID=2997340 RepID=UPI002271E6A9|nr:hypothetical protein [Frigidibacter sp. RF13]MCY1128499.1 hypothetical protein [Frigidibacter sp. RF13]